MRFLTVRDSDDPDALSVLRHSSAHLLAEAVRRLYPGVKVAIGPAIENGFYYDFEFPEPIAEDDLAAIEAEVRARAGARAAAGRASEISREEAQRRFEAEGEPYKVELVESAEGEITLYTQSHDGRREFTDLCRGPHLQDSAPIKAFKLTGLAGAYWRGDEHNTQLTRIYGTAFFTPGRPRRATSSGSRRRAGATTAGSALRLDLFHLSEHSPGLAVLAPARGW